MQIQPTRGPAQLHQALRRAVDHIARVGIDINKGRIREYFAAFDSAAAKRFVERKLLFSAAESTHDLEQLCGIPVEKLQAVRTRLGKIAGGDAVHSIASGHDPGRDLIFELLTAAFLGGFATDVDLQRPSDASAVVDGHPIQIECKRPTSSTALANSLTGAYKQLYEHRRRGIEGFGIVAVDASLLINPHGGYLPAASPQIASDHLVAYLVKMKHDAQAELARWERNRKDEARVHMLLFRIRVMAGDEVAAPYVAEQWAAELQQDQPEGELATLYEIVQRHASTTPGITAIPRLPKR